MEKIKTTFTKLSHWQYFPLIVLLLVSLGLHLATITRPNEPLFDEQHYVPDARRIVNGEGTLRMEHPPLAKLIVAGGIKIFGDNPWGWRMPAVILSIIALMAFYDICRRLGTSHRTAFLATLLLSTENLMFIHSGMAMLDIFEVVLTIFAFWLYLKGPRWWWAAAVSVALAGLCKFSGILTIIPIGLHWLIIGFKPNMGNPVEIAQTHAPITEQSSFGVTVTERAQTLHAENVTIMVGEICASSSETQLPESPQIIRDENAAISQATDGPIPDASQISIIQSAPTKKSSFWASYGRPITFILSMTLAPIAFFLFYGVFEMIIWTKWIPFVVWGYWDQGIVGDIKNALSLTNSIKFSYDGAFPSRPWEWILSPTGSFYFYGWLFNPDNYKNIMLPYWYTPSYSGMINPSLWLSGLAVIPFVIWKSFKKNNAAIFVVCWITGTWLVWIPLFLATNRITYMFYYLPTIGAIALGTALVVSAFLNKAQAKAKGFRKRFLDLSMASFLLVHLLSFCILSPLHLWLSIPVGAMLLLFVLFYMGLGWSFNIEFYLCAAIASLIMRFALYWPLRDWLVTGNAPWGLPEVSLLWAVSVLIGLAIAWILFMIIHLSLNRIIRNNTSPPQNDANLPPLEVTQP